jgi:cytoskeletal protein RodZ
MEDDKELTYSEKKTKKTLYGIIGRKIFESRRSSRKKLEGISKKLNINLDVLRKIESGEIENIEQNIHLNGFIRAFAKITDTDVSFELKSLEENYSIDKAARDIFSKMQNTQTSKIILVFVSSFCFLLLVFYFLSISEDKREEIMTRDINPSAEDYFNSDYTVQTITKDFGNENLTNGDQPEKKDVILEKKSKLDFFEINFMEETWIEIYDKNESLLESGLFKVGQTLRFQFKTRESDFFIKSGNLGGFQIFYKNEFFPPFGSSGEVTRGFFLKKKIDQIKGLGM